MGAEEFPTKVDDRAEQFATVGEAEERFGNDIKWLIPGR